MSDREAREVLENYKAIPPRGNRHGVVFDKRDPLGPELSTAYRSSNGGMHSMRARKGTREWDDARSLLVEYRVLEVQS